MNTQTTAQHAREFAESKVFSDVISRYVSGIDKSAPQANINMVIHSNDQMLDHSLKHFGEVGPADTQIISP